MLIENAKGRKDGHSGYSRLLGNEELGCLISKLQSTVISNGTELEKMILDRSKLIDELDSFVFKAIEGAMPQGVYVCTKKVFKQSKVYYIDALKGIEPDLLVFVVEVNRVCKIVELKDGDAFDTKKSQGEYEHLSTFSTIFGARIPFVAEFYICSFNQDDKEIIYNGFKKKFDYSHILTGKELCEILNIDYDEILELRKKDREANLQYFLDELYKIDDVRNYFKQKFDRR